MSDISSDFLPVTPGDQLSQLPIGAQQSTSAVTHPANWLHLARRLFHSEVSADHKSVKVSFSRAPGWPGEPRLCKATYLVRCLCHEASPLGYFGVLPSTLSGLQIAKLITWQEAPKRELGQTPDLGPGLSSPRTFYHIKCVKTVPGPVREERHTLTGRAGIDGDNLRQSTTPANRRTNQLSPM